MEKLFEKYKSIIMYLIFGILTTLVNVILYYVFARILNCSTLLATAIAWVGAVLFAYFTNRTWVFESHVNGTKEIIREMISFFACRLLTGFLDVAMMYIFVDVFKFNDMVIKLGSNIIVIILNYIASKLIIFRKKEN